MSGWLITGGTGSLGQALTHRLVADPTVDRVIVYSRDELKQAQMADALGAAAALDGGKVRFFLGDVRDLQRLGMALRGVDVVVHAAALKRVDAIAYNPSEVVQTNVVGSWNVCLAAMRHGVTRTVFISSDKAVAPTNIYGASKYLAERLVVGANTYGVPGGQSFTVVRYGNVAGSRGSVIHLWRRAVAEGRPLMLTDERMTRFWLTLDDACHLVRYAADPRQVEAGEVVVPVLPRFRVLDLARAVAGEAGAREVTGRRSGGEKLHESLLSEPEIALTVRRGSVYIVRPDPHPWTAARPARGDPLPEGFTYTSDGAPRLSVGELLERLAEVPAEAR